MDGIISKQFFVINLNGIIIKANNRFCRFTEYREKEIVGTSVKTLFTSLLRMELDYDLIGQEADSFIFTKSLRVRNVHILKTNDDDSGNTLFFINEIPNSRFEVNNHHLEQLLNENVLGVGVFTTKFTLIKANQAYLDYLPSPFNSKEISYGKTLNVIDKDFISSENGYRAWKDIIKTKKSLYFEEKLNLINKDNQFWDNTITPIIENGQVKYLVSMRKNVTGKVLGREFCKQQIRQLEILLDNMADYIIAIDKDGNIVYLNKAVKDFRKKYSINFVNETYFNTKGVEIPKSDLPGKRLLQGVKTRNERLVVKRDHDIIFDCNSNYVNDESGQLKLGIMSFRDVTKTVEKERKVKLEKEQMEALLYHMHEALIISDPSGHILKMNRKAMKILEVKESNVSNRIEYYFPRYDFIDTDGNLIPYDNWPLSRSLSKERFSNWELWLHYNDVTKEPCLCSFSGAPVYNNNGDNIFCIMTFTDITKQRSLQEELYRTIKEKNRLLSEAMEYKDEFLYMITHEMKTPLAVISSALQAMNLVCKNPTYKTDKYIKTIKQNTNRQIRLVNNLLDIVKITSGRIQMNYTRIDIVSLAYLITQSIQPIAMQKKVQINFSSDLKRKTMLIDEEKLERILLNLLSNALKFTPEYKAITVRVYNKKVKNSNMLCISVLDEGIGIPKEKHSIIFERFGQVNTHLSRPAEGTGIGLYLVKLTIDAMGGLITLESEEGVGSNFTIMLPYIKSTGEAHEARRKENIDERLIRELEIQFSDIYF